MAARGPALGEVGGVDSLEAWARPYFHQRDAEGSPRACLGVDSGGVGGSSGSRYGWMAFSTMEVRVKRPGMLFVFFFLFSSLFLPACVNFFFIVASAFDVRCLRRGFSERRFVNSCKTRFDVTVVACEVWSHRGSLFREGVTGVSDTGSPLRCFYFCSRSAKSDGAMVAMSGICSRS